MASREMKITLGSQNMYENPTKSMAIASAREKRKQTGKEKAPRNSFSIFMSDKYFDVEFDNISQFGCVYGPYSKKPSLCNQGGSPFTYDPQVRKLCRNAKMLPHAAYTEMNLLVMFSCKSGTRKRCFIWLSALFYSIV